MSDHPLDHPAWSALTGCNAGFALVQGPARRFVPEISPFAAIDPTAEPGEAWRALASLAGAGQDLVVVAGPEPAQELPDGWTVPLTLPGFQLVAQDLQGEPDAEAVELGAADVEEMIALVGRTKPGPFARRTHEFGRYLGIRREGVLVAMAGERMRFPDHVEISAVCTDASVRGQGLAVRLIRAVAYGIRQDGAVPMLHVAGSNTSALRVYDALGFRPRRPVVFHGVRTPVEANVDVNA